MKKIFSFLLLMATMLLIGGNAWAQNVAKIGTTEYATFADAVTAVADGETIVLIDNVDLGANTYQIDKTGVAFTLDLNGYNIKGSKFTSATYGILRMVHGTMTIKTSQPNGSIGVLGESKYSLNVSSSSSHDGTVILESGTICGLSYVVNLSNGTGKFIMNGGEIVAEGTVSTVYDVFIDNATSSAEINGGKIIARTSTDNVSVIGVNCKGTLTINDVEMLIQNNNSAPLSFSFTGGTTGVENILGGKFVANGSTTAVSSLFSKTTNIFGGQFNRDVQTWIPLGEPYMCQANAGLGTCFGQALTHEIVDDPTATAYIRNVTQGKDYLSISTALAEAADNDEFCALQDMDFGEASFIISQPITFDVNGHKLSANSAVFKLTGGADAAHTLVLTDKAVEKGLISAGAPIQLVGGYVTVDNVKVKATSHCFYEPTDAGNFTIQNVVATTTATASAAATVYNANNKKSTVTFSNCTFTLDASTLTATATTSSYPSVFKNGAACMWSIDGGTYKVINTNATNSKYAGIFNGTSAKISINDGMFRVEGAATTKYLSKATTSGTIPNVKIYGGTFDIDPSTWVANGFVANESAGIYTVVESNVASVNGTEYASIDEAIAAAHAYSYPVVLLHSTKVGTTLTIPAGVTFAPTSYTLDLAANTALKLEDGATMPACIANTNFEASIHANNATRYFYSLDKGITACGATETVTLLRDAATTAQINITSGTKTIDFNGHNMTGSNTIVFYVKSMLTGSVDVRFTNGSSTESVVECTNANLQSEGLRVESAGGAVNVTVGHGVTIKGSYGATVWKKVTLNVDGKIVGKRAFAVCGNGSTGNGGTTININNGAVIESLDNTAIYHPQEGTLNIYGGTITGATALAVKAGTVNISGGTLHATGECGRQSGWSNGVAASGAAIQLESNKSYAAHVNLTITGGEFISDNCYAFYEYIAKNSERSSADVIDIQNGTFQGNIQISQDLAYQAGGFITGGTYDHDVVAFCKAGYTTKLDNGVYVAVPRQTQDDKQVEALTLGQEVEMPATTVTSQVTISGDVTVSTTAEDAEVQKVVLGPGSDLIVKEGTTLNVGAGGVHIEDTEGSPATVTIEAGGTLTVDGLIYNSTTTNFVIESQEGNPGVLLISPKTEVIGEDHPKATIEFVSKGYKRGAGDYVWQRFGVPAYAGMTRSGIKCQAAGISTATYWWNYDADEWQPSTGADMQMTPFVCYTMTNTADAPGTKYVFECEVLGNGDATLEFRPGWNYYANSYTAPIDIEAMLSEYITAHPNVQAVVYAYQPEGNTWDPITLGELEEGEAAQTSINPMQAFIFKNNAAAMEAKVNYQEFIWDPVMNANVAAPARAQKSNATRATIIMTGADGLNDKLVIREEARFSNEFDNGYDAEKYTEGDRATLVAEGGFAQLSNVATDDLNGLALTLNTLNETVFTLSFQNVYGEELAIRDNLTGTVLTIAEGAVYNFSAAANTQVMGRFEIVKAPKVATSVEDMQANDNSKAIYSLTGIYMGEDWNAVPAGVYVVNGVKMVK